MVARADQFVVPPIPIIGCEPVMHFTTAQVCACLNCSPASLRSFLKGSHPAADILNRASSSRGRSKRTYFYAAVYRAADLLGNGEAWPLVTPKRSRVTSHRKPRQPVPPHDSESETATRTG